MRRALLVLLLAILPLHFVWGEVMGASSKSHMDLNIQIHSWANDQNEVTEESISQESLLASDLCHFGCHAQLFTYVLIAKFPRNKQENAFLSLPTYLSPDLPKLEKPKWQAFLSS